MTANIGADFEENAGGVVLFGQTLSAKTLGIALGVIGIATAGYIFFNFVQPLWTTIDTTKSGIDSKKASIADKDTQIKQKADLPQKVAAAKERSETVLSLLPSQDSMDTLLIDLNKLIKSSNVSPIQLSGNLLESFSPTPPGPIVPEGQYRTQTLNIQFAAAYSDLITILRSIESLKTLIVVQDIQLTKRQNVTIRNPGNLTPEQQKAQIARLPPVLSVTFRLVAYIPASDEEIKTLAQAAAATKK
ncbi:Tfp pilus assembly protein PilO [Synechococcus sp. PCC 7502]|uniref:type 4a pilus biogenesis protein PilO n=1 Tax=Synechococcus sp. PCC 7502 TaxID=1173263 RepID=UPI00029F8F58|nr:type 4a pilus biogenesis protein PilO [Synechococcus sp. PCC 7502]AFY72747.1 Tfp pilus assembly protein PilO [Synechococcus sp. PCC 7502]